MLAATTASILNQPSTAIHQTYQNPIPTPSSAPAAMPARPKPKMAARQEVRQMRKASQAPLVGKSVLDAAGCDTPNCAHDHSILYLHGLCHPESNREVFYEKASGQLVVACHECKKEIVRVEVAP